VERLAHDDVAFDRQRHDTAFGQALAQTRERDRDYRNERPCPCDARYPRAEAGEHFPLAAGAFGKEDHDSAVIEGGDHIAGWIATAVPMDRDHAAERARKPASKPVAEAIGRDGNANMAKGVPGQQVHQRRCIKIAVVIGDDQRWSAFR
jgi:hypothetical protein